MEIASRSTTVTAFTPPCDIEQNSLIGGSAVSSVTNNTARMAASASANTPIAVNNVRRTSPSTSTTEFSRPCSDDNSLISGDDEERWDREAELILTAAAGNSLEDMTDAENMTDESPPVEILEFDQLMQEAETDGQEEMTAVTPLNGGGVEYEIVSITMKSTVAELKEIAKAVNVGIGGNKATLFARIRDSGSNLILRGDNNESFQFKKVATSSAAEGGSDGGIDPNAPYWIILNPEIPPPIPGVDMSTGAEIGFFGPTNANNSAGAQKHNFLMHPLERIKRPTFSSMDPSKSINDDGHPSVKAKNAIPRMMHAWPIDFFNLMITPRFVEKVMVACTNQKAAAEGARVGGTLYKDFVPFDVDEMYRFIGLLFANGLAPKPDITKWFEGSSTDQLLGSDFIAPLMNKRLPRGGNVPGIRRWRHFWCFLCLYDFRQNAKDAAAKDPLWKIRLMLHHLNKQARLMWVTGKSLSVDEQTIAFKGKSSMKLWILYKKEGDGFQCNTICN